jgi:hypothetical protein
MRLQVTDVIGGTTLRATWISSGTSVDSIYSHLLSNSETVVNTATPVSSGDGHYFALHPIPTTPGWYVNEWIALIAANTYVNRQFVRAIRPEVD